MTVARALRAVVRINLLLLALVSSYQIRLFAVQNYGRVIHEFDPWFNYRAAEYLKANGAERFFKWFDHTVWYPLGRPVGTTIYPGMQFAAVWIWQILKMAQVEMSLHDVCVFIPAWLLQEVISVHLSCVYPSFTHPLPLVSVVAFELSQPTALTGSYISA